MPILHRLADSKWAIIGAVLLGIGAQCFTLQGRIDQAAADVWQDAAEGLKAETQED